MKALSLTQPWATLVAIGAKRIETRSWYTNYRGLLAIHAASSFPWRVRLLCLEHPYIDVLIAGGISLRSLKEPLPGFPRGAIIAVVDLVDCLETGEGFVAPPEPEWSFGDFSPGRFAWILENVCRLKKPLACKGMLGLWESPQITPDMY